MKFCRVEDLADPVSHKGTKTQRKSSSLRAFV